MNCVKCEGEGEICGHAMRYMEADECPEGHDWNCRTYPAHMSSTIDHSRCLLVYSL